MIALAIMLAQAAKPAPTVLIWGFGSASCARAWLPENIDITHNWILGFWSGVNNTETLKVGRHTDADGIFAEVQRVCSLQPANPLYVATDRAFANLHKRGL